MCVAGAFGCGSHGAPRYVGAATCAPCHQPETLAWQRSDHARAMHEASDSAVLGDFADRTLVYYGDTVRFRRTDGHPVVTIGGPDGRPRDYQPVYTFGFYPLQQYLVAFARGRFQALPVAWDTRPASAGGQRWFHLYPDEPIRAGDELYWTGRAQNWNYMCADCHSTDLRKRYLATTDSFATAWWEINVACEACHGPGSLHVAAAQRVVQGGNWRDSTPLGFPVRFDERAGVTWHWDSVALRPRRSLPPSGFRPEIETCARCHARRSQVWPAFTPGRPLLDSYRPSLLEPGLYFPDGQINGEVYEYGSFLQSKMYRAGVTCSDCHDPHSGKLRTAPDVACSSCHLPSRYETPQHHHHQVGKAGSSCVDCHMATRTYMVVDVRRDHSMRIPRPDLSVRLGVPNACNACHANRSPQWAEQALSRWFKPRRETGPHWGEAFALARRHDTAATEALVRVALDTAAGPWVRSSALAALSDFLTAPALDAVAPLLGDRDPLVRFGAVRALQGLAPEVRLPLVAPLLSDSTRVVRMEAASLLAPVPDSEMHRAERRAFDQAAWESETSENYNADQPWAYVNLGVFASDRHDFPGAERAYREAIHVDSAWIPAYVNLADLYRAQSRDSLAEPLLRKAIAIAPATAEAHYALGLLLVRKQRLSEAIPELRRAAELRPDDQRFQEVLRAAEGKAGPELQPVPPGKPGTKRTPGTKGKRGPKAKRGSQGVPGSRPGP
ncbi:MAG TPA: HEAT repeat domain-containing protein [Gemmatimonadales bacterium]|nr:HEAT repeat domain-containing protein [Gemmatimonadales bacterium]